MKTITIIVPVYYNENSLAALFTALQKLEAQLSERECALELIFVDDGSGDNSFAELMRIKQQRESTRIVKLARNFGAMEASKIGLNFAHGDAFMWLSADLQDPPDLIPDLVDRWLAGSKFVIYARAGRDDPLSTRLTAKIYYVLLRLFVVRDYPEGGYDLALMDKVMLPYLRDSAKNVNTTLLAFWLGFEPEIMQYRRREREHGQSMWSMRKKIKFFVDTFLGFSMVPIRLMTVIGLVVSLLSFVYGGIIVAYAVFGVSDVAGFPTLVALITFLLGLIIIMLGIIGEYIWRIYDQLSGRPEVVIDEIY